MVLNAKERRKLLRQQQREGGDDAPVKEEVKAEVVAQVEEPTENKPLEQMNAKERRKAMREQQRQAEGATTAKTEPAKTEKKEKKEATEPVAAAGPPGERLNSKQRRLLQRKVARGDDDESSKPSAKAQEKPGKKRKRSAKSENGADGEGDENAAKKKRIHLTLFVGQLPFNATADMVRKHFAEAGQIQLRMLTDKKTGKFRGTAFIEVKDSKALGAALSRHHSLLNGRRINVELTASGGGNNSTLRREKIDGLRKKQSEKQLEKTRALVQKHIDAPESKFKEDDVDERMIDFLSWFDYETAKKALEEYNKSVSDRVQNRKAFFMGILKRFRQTDGVE
ncbi:hypothetical protein Poli38472_009137 [Pythium oligandrum]|uniref:RRM domain-containing protein n=1 Tax=Pythium oligandrum TaxID=41045 RepID=A0A8K1CLS0_PYTOL|nr:hypothetical protein Poli38472_009137 [Pythium oligandrum]|eukprot:TMW64970.1 hypothetical protein Poli38472_009137 [Pythium oligandrum]